MYGAENEYRLPLDVFAELHKKNPRIFGTKTAGFFHKNGKRACLYAFSAEVLFLVEHKIYF
jgi:hypothetical protein